MAAAARIRRRSASVAATARGRRSRDTAADVATAADGRRRTGRSTAPRRSRRRRSATGTAAVDVARRRRRGGEGDDAVAVAAEEVDGAAADVTVDATLGVAAPVVGSGVCEPPPSALSHPQAVERRAGRRAGEGATAPLAPPMVGCRECRGGEKTVGWSGCRPPVGGGGCAGVGGGDVGDRDTTRGCRPSSSAVNGSGLGGRKLPAMAYGWRGAAGGVGQRGGCVPRRERRHSLEVGLPLPDASSA